MSKISKSEHGVIKSTLSKLTGSDNKTEYYWVDCWYVDFKKSGIDPFNSYVRSIKMAANTITCLQGKYVNKDVPMLSLTSYLYWLPARIRIWIKKRIGGAKFAK